MPRHIYLTKDSDDLISHCRCNNALVTFPPQADCPWCGCGWLFTCIECRKAFTFARGVETDEDWEDLARRDLGNRTGSTPIPEEIHEWVEAMQELLHDVEVGKKYVVFDGRIIPTDQQSLDFDGWHSTHRLPFVPQVAALTNPSILKEVLTSEEYWQSHRLEDFDPSALGTPAIRDRKRWWEFWK